MNVPNSRQNNQNGMAAMLAQLMMNPSRAISQQGFNVPPNMMNDPDMIIQYLLNTGQVSQEQYDNADSLYRQIMQNQQNRQYSFPRPVRGRQPRF